MEQPEHSGPGCWEGMGILPNTPSQLPGMAGDSLGHRGTAQVATTAGLIHHRGPERGYRRERDGSSLQAWPSPPGESREAGTSCPTGTGQLEAPTLELSLGKFNVTEPRVNW